MIPKSLILLVVLTSLVACAHQQTVVEEEVEAVSVDPLEGLNRSIFKLNAAIDLVLLEPAAKLYRKTLPSPVRRGVSNVFQNLLEPTTIVNDLLQAKPHNAVADTVRFFVNTVFGLGGWFDVAEKMGLERHDEDFGQTLARWGMGPGPYLVLPLLGPSTLRDAAGLVPYYTLTDPRTQLEEGSERLPPLLLDGVNQRSQLLGASKVLELQLDPYLFTRDAYLQRRQYLIYDGDPPTELFDEEL